MWMLRAVARLPIYAAVVATLTLIVFLAMR